ncbi:cytochrome o ubiquinol oxidase subunit I [Candidatus Saccharibacteria bacterium]|nr:cytochrome o ubiquinol oxidase subunit I [Candidatus Saccharibacteria bacterium]
MLGRLTLDALPSEPITIGGAVMMTLSFLGIVGLLLYFKKTKWLWKNWLTSLDHKKIGVMYIVVAVVMLLRGVADAAMMRTQQALAADAPGIVHSDMFQQVFSAHGTIMIFFVAMGLMFGIINLILPLQIGARDVAFPFLNSVSFWLFVAGMVLINISLVIGEFSTAGWLAYPPLSGLEYSPGVGVDYWIWALQIAGIGSLLSGVNFFVTIIKKRAPGMTMMKMPMFTWSVLITMVMILFAFPILTATLAMLALDRTMGMHFFTSSFGGNPMMYINLIWAWGHPEVYILILPAFGMFSEIVPVFTRKRLFGYASMAFALGSIAFLSFIVWLHHFFTMGAGANVNAFFGIMTMIIAIPTGVKVFNWLFTMFRGRITFTTPMVWFMGFIFTFTIGGLTGVLLAVPAIDFQMHNSLFLVAHFHNMIIGGVVFGYFAGLAYWFPKITGFKLNDQLGKAAAWCWVIGFAVAFVPLYILGMMGATRRLDHYAVSTGWQPLFVIAAFGGLIIMTGICLQILQLVHGIWFRKRNLDKTGDPWDGRTLEWSTTSPAPFYNFATIPKIHSRDEFWERKQSNSRQPKHEYQDIHLPKNTGLGIMIAAMSLIFGFAIVWHIWWLAVVSLFVAIALLLVRFSDDDTEYVVTAEDLAKLEGSRRYA